MSAPSLDRNGADGRPSLADDLVAGPLHFGEVAWIGRCLAEQFEQYHRFAIVRGFLTPADVVFASDGHPVLLRATTPPADLAHPLLAPEVRAGRPPTVAADVYALGALLCLALSGKPPPLEATELRSGPPVELARLVSVLDRATAHAPVDRFFTAGALVEALDAVFEGEQGHGRSSTALKVLAGVAAVGLIGWLGARAADAGIDGLTSGSVAAASDAAVAPEPPATGMRVVARPPVPADPPVAQLDVRLGDAPVGAGVPAAPAAAMDLVADPGAGTAEPPARSPVAPGVVAPPSPPAHRPAPDVAAGAGSRGSQPSVPTPRADDSEKAKRGKHEERLVSASSGDEKGKPRSADQ